METDATKRALSTFGNFFGLSLYRDNRDAPQPKKAPGALAKTSAPTKVVDIGDDEVMPVASEDSPKAPGSSDPPMIETTIPIWVPASERAGSLTNLELKSEPTHPEKIRDKIEKSTLPIGEPKRIRN